MNLSILKKCIKFNHEKGEVIKLETNEHTVLISKFPKNAKKYPKIRIDGKYYLAHRLAWMDYYNIKDYSDIPKCIDHINRNKWDYSINNLRETSIGENNRNRNKKTDYLKYGRCVTYNDLNDTYIARIVFDGGIHYTEIFNELTDAQEFVKNKFQIHAPWMIKNE